MADIQIIQNVLGPIGTNCYTLINRALKQALIIDPAANPEVFSEHLDKEGAALKAILLTHAHFDHMGAVRELKSMYPEADVYIGRNDEDMLGDPESNLSYPFTGVSVTAEADRALRDGEELELIGARIRVIEVPGHTKGGVCYYFPEEKLLFSGDTLFCGSIGRSDFPTGNGPLLVRSIEEKLLTLPEDTNVFPGHDSLTNIGHEKRTNMYFAF